MLWGEFDQLGEQCLFSNLACKVLAIISSNAEISHWDRSAWSPFEISCCYLVRRFETPSIGQIIRTIKNRLKLGFMGLSIYPETVYEPHKKEEYNIGIYKCIPICPDLSGSAGIYSGKRWFCITLIPQDISPCIFNIEMSICRKKTKTGQFNFKTIGSDCFRYLVLYYLFISFILITPMLEGHPKMK